MTFLGNIFLALATLIFFMIFSAVFIKEQPRGGDAVMGYAWGILLLNLALLVLLALAAIIIAWKGGFDWISPNKTSRYLLVALGLLAAMATSALSALFKGEPDAMASLIKLLSGFAPILIPLILIITGVILLNDGLRTAVPLAAYKFPLLLVFSLGILGVGAMLVGWMIESNKNALRQIASIEERQDQNHLRLLQDIDSCDVSKDMVFILVLCDANQDPEVREKAVAKVKTNPQWQEELIRRLENEWAPEAFNFLASNEVPDKAMFAEPVRKGVLNQALVIRKSIRRSSHPSHFYPELFSWEVERVLRTVDKFEGLGTDYLPAIRELRAALDEPSDYPKPKFRCLALLDGWIQRH